MKAVVSTQKKWSVVPLNIGLLDPEMVRIRIVLAGLCRTDIQTMTGQRLVSEGRVLGHEAAGVVEMIGSKACNTMERRGIYTGNRVAFFPFLPCKTCPACQNSERIDHCWSLKSVGVDVDGAFASFVDLPPEVVYRADDNLPWEALAYAEPVAAALSALDVDDFLESGQSLGLLGSGRIATLTERILTQVAGRQLERVDENTPSNSLDALIETRATAETIQRAVEVLKPGGVLFAKSRPAESVAWPHQTLIHKRLRVQGLHYGDFEQGLDLMGQGTLDVSDCWGRVFDFDEAGISAALEMESGGQESEGKLFFKIGEESK